MSAHVAAILADPGVDFEEVDDDLPAGTVRVGGVDEAEACAACFAELVEATPAVGDWLEEGLRDVESSVQRGDGERRSAEFKVRKRKSR